jgi:TRAP-type C4-dicarboxylate transport system substrate-binding protein
MNLSKRKPLDFVPMGKVSISETGTDLWDFSLKINKAVWRSLPFQSQQQIIRVMTDFQSAVDDLVTTQYQELKNECEATEPEQQPEPEQSAKQR